MELNIQQQIHAVNQKLNTQWNLAKPINGGTRDYAVIYDLYEQKKVLRTQLN